MKAKYLGIALAATLLPAPVFAFNAVNDMVVEDVGNGQFSVAWREDSGDEAFWCAAGDYVVSHLAESPDSPVWRITPPPREAGQAIVFSLNPEGAAGTTGLSTTPDDGSLTAAAADALCGPHPHAN